MIAVIVFVCLGIISWLVYEAINAPLIDDWHDECVKSRESKDSTK